MKVVYIANDGKEFDDEWDCEEHEWLIAHKALNEIMFFNASSEPIKWSFKDEFYSNTYAVVVTNDSQIKALHDFADYTGFCCFEDIDSCGKWVWKDPDTYWDNGTFVKVV